MYCDVSVEFLPTVEKIQTGIYIITNSNYCSKIILI